MRSFLASAVFLGLVGIVAGPGVAEASCAQPCHEMLCVGAQTVLEASQSRADGDNVTIRIDRIHGLDDGTWKVGDTFEIPQSTTMDFEGGLWFVDEFEQPFGFIPTRSGEAICPRHADTGIDLALAIDIALSEDCMAAAEEALGPIPACKDTFFTTTCAAGPGTAGLLTATLAAAVFAIVRRRRPASPRRERTAQP